MEKTNIYLESASNDFQMIGFVLGGQCFGVNAAKIKGIVEYKKTSLTPLPKKHSSILGMYTYREQTFPLIDLHKHLEVKPQKTEYDRKIVLIMEFNNTLSGFFVDEVLQIYRISWSQINEVHNYLTKIKTYITGSTHIDDKEILIIDFEYILSELNRNTNVEYQDVTEVQSDDKEVIKNRKNIKIFFAEDSATIRNLVVKTLESTNYDNIKIFSNGLDLYTFVSDKKDNIKEYVDVIISDIEMPKMNGLTLCDKIKNELKLNIPIIMFSSLINEQIIKKCQNVNADAQISKPEVKNLIKILDNILLK
jgi:two-component system chemotaxis response regulator CheV